MIVKGLITIFTNINQAGKLIRGWSLSNKLYNLTNGYKNEDNIESLSENVKKLKKAIRTLGGSTVSRTSELILAFLTYLNTENNNILLFNYFNTPGLILVGTFSAILVTIALEVNNKLKESNLNKMHHILELTVDNITGFRNIQPQYNRLSRKYEFLSKVYSNNFNNIDIAEERDTSIRSKWAKDKQTGKNYQNDFKTISLIPSIKKALSIYLVSTIFNFIKPFINGLEFSWGKVWDSLTGIIQLSLTIGNQYTDVHNKRSGKIFLYESILGIHDKSGKSKIGINEITNHYAINDFKLKVLQEFIKESKTIKVKNETDLNAMKRFSGIWERKKIDCVAEMRKFSKQGKISTIFNAVVNELIAGLAQKVNPIIYYTYENILSVNSLNFNSQPELSNYQVLPDNRLPLLPGNSRSSSLMASSKSPVNSLVTATGIGKSPTGSPAIMTRHLSARLKQSSPATSTPSSPIPSSPVITAQWPDRPLRHSSLGFSRSSASSSSSTSASSSPVIVARPLTVSLPPSSPVPSSSDASRTSSPTQPSKMKEKFRTMNKLRIAANNLAGTALPLSPNLSEAGFVRASSDSDLRKRGESGNSPSDSSQDNSPTIFPKTPQTSHRSIRVLAKERKSSPPVLTAEFDKAIIHQNDNSPTLGSTSEISSDDMPHVSMHPNHRRSSRAVVQEVKAQEIMSSTPLIVPAKFDEASTLNTSGVVQRASTTSYSQSPTSSSSAEDLHQHVGIISMEEEAQVTAASPEVLNRTVMSIFHSAFRPKKEVALVHKSSALSTSAAPSISSTASAVFYIPSKLVPRSNSTPECLTRPIIKSGGNSLHPSKSADQIDVKDGHVRDLALTSRTSSARHPVKSESSDDELSQEAVSVYCGALSESPSSSEHPLSTPAGSAYPSPTVLPLLPSDSPMILTPAISSIKNVQNADISILHPTPPAASSSLSISVGGLPPLLELPPSSPDDATVRTPRSLATMRESGLRDNKARAR
jgi:hypothetical protein